MDNIYLFAFNIPGRGQAKKAPAPVSSRYADKRQTTNDKRLFLAGRSLLPVSLSSLVVCRPRPLCAIRYALCPS